MKHTQVLSDFFRFVPVVELHAILRVIIFIGNVHERNLFGCGPWNVFTFKEVSGCKIVWDLLNWNVLLISAIHFPFIGSFSFFRALYKGQTFWIAAFFSETSCRPLKKLRLHSFAAEWRTCNHRSLAERPVTAIGFNCSDINCSSPLSPNNNMPKAP